jgi:hypothetical protein
VACDDFVIGVGVAQGRPKNLHVMNHARIHPEYRLIHGNTKDEVAQAAAPFLKDGWVALYDPLFGRPAAWETKECWSQTLIRAARREPDGENGDSRSPMGPK